MADTRYAGTSTTRRGPIRWPRFWPRHGHKIHGARQFAIEVPVSDVGLRARVVRSVWAFRPRLPMQTGCKYPVGVAAHVRHGAAELVKEAVRRGHDNRSTAADDSLCQDVCFVELGFPYAPLRRRSFRAVLAASRSGSKGGRAGLENGAWIVLPNASHLWCEGFCHDREQGRWV